MAMGPVLKTLCTRLSLQERVKTGPKSFVQMQKKGFHGWEKIQLINSRFNGIWPQHARKPCVTRGPLRYCCRHPGKQEMSLPWGFCSFPLSLGLFDCLMASHKYSWGSCSSCRWALWQAWWIFRPADWSLTSVVLTLQQRGKVCICEQGPDEPGLSGKKPQLIVQLQPLSYI